MFATSVMYMEFSLGGKGFDPRQFVAISPASPSEKDDEVKFGEGRGTTGLDEAWQGNDMEGGEMSASRRDRRRRMKGSRKEGGNGEEDDDDDQIEEEVKIKGGKDGKGEERSVNIHGGKEEETREGKEGEEEEDDEMDRTEDVEAVGMEKDEEGDFTKEEEEEESGGEETERMGEEAKDDDDVRVEANGVERRGDDEMLDDDLWAARMIKLEAREGGLGSKGEVSDGEEAGALADKGNAGEEEGQHPSMMGGERKDGKGRQEEKERTVEGSLSEERRAEVSARAGSGERGEGRGKDSRGEETVRGFSPDQNPGGRESAREKEKQAWAEEEAEEEEEEVRKKKASATAMPLPVPAAGESPKAEPNMSEAPQEKPDPAEESSANASAESVEAAEGESLPKGRQRDRFTSPVHDERKIPELQEGGGRARGKEDGKEGGKGGEKEVAPVPTVPKRKKSPPAPIPTAPIGQTCEAFLETADRYTPAKSPRDFQENPVRVHKFGEHTEYPNCDVRCLFETNDNYGAYDASYDKTWEGVPRIKWTMESFTNYPDTEVNRAHSNGFEIVMTPRLDAEVSCVYFGWSPNEVFFNPMKVPPLRAAQKENVAAAYIR
jgi:hypothetical protein